MGLAGQCCLWIWLRDINWKAGLGHYQVVGCDGRSPVVIKSLIVQNVVAWCFVSGVAMVQENI